MCLQRFSKKIWSKKSFVEKCVFWFDLTKIPLKITKTSFMTRFYFKWGYQDLVVRCEVKTFLPKEGICWFEFTNIQFKITKNCEGKILIQMGLPRFGWDVWSKNTLAKIGIFWFEFTNITFKITKRLVWLRGWKIP